MLEVCPMYMDTSA